MIEQSESATTGAETTTFPVDPAAYIDDLALNYLRLAAREPNRIGKRDRKLTATATAEYEGRFLVELIQNAYDAHPSDRSDGLIVVDLDSDDGEFGTLWVGNAGNPFSTSNVEAIAEIANSDKRPDQGVGNKGVGFRAVLRICEWPEIYSRAPSSSAEGYDGFCFGFARPKDMERLMSELGPLASAVPRVSPYCVLAPVGPVPGSISPFTARGLATVIRLPLRSRQAADLVRSEVEWLTRSPQPLLLFLDRIGQLEVRIRPNIPVPQKRSIRDVAKTGKGASLQLVELRPGGTYLVSSRVLEPHRVSQAIKATVDAGLLDEEWLEWSEPVTVSVAAPQESAGERGVFYTYLPMDQANSPCGCHINAPFITKMARRDLDPTIEVNALYVRESAAIALEAALWARDTGFNKATVVDLAAWEGSLGSYIDQAVKDRAGANVEAIIPVAGPGSRWKRLADCHYWAVDGLGVLTPDRVARLQSVNLIEPDLGSIRLARLDRVSQERHGRPLAPRLDEIAGWAEGLAGAFPASFSPALWDEFYGDLAKIFGRNAGHLVGRKILLDDDGRLREGTGRAERRSHPRPATAVFFPPLQGTDTADTGDEANKADIPSSLRSRLVYMNRRLTWFEALPTGGRRARPARGFLESAGLVQEFRTETLLDYTREISARTKKDSVRADILLWSYRLVRAMRGEAPASLESLGLRVPTRSGWLPAAEAYFGPEWGDDGGLTLAALIKETGASVADISSLQQRFLVPPLEMKPQVKDVEGWVDFLRRIGVKSGLHPITNQVSVPLVPGQELTVSWLADQLSLPVNLRNWWVERLTERGCRANRYELYRVAGSGWYWPGQESFSSFGDAAKRSYSKLLLGRLDLLDHQRRFLSIGRPDGREDKRDQQSWPTPAQLFLEEQEWIPMSQPGERQKFRYEPPTRTWYVDDLDDQPDFAPLLAGEVARAVRSRDGLRLELEGLGMKLWNEPKHSSYLVEFLGDLMVTSPPSDARAAAFKKTYQRAWLEAVSSGRLPYAETPEGQPARLVVTRSGRLETVDLGSLPESAVVYVQDAEESTVTRLIEELGWPIVRMERAGDGVVRALARLAGSQIQATSSVDLRVLVDNEEFEPSPNGELLAGADRSWVRELILLAYEFQPRSADALTRSPASLRRFADSLDRVRVKWAGSLELELGGTRIPRAAHATRPLPLRDERAPTLVVVEPRDWNWESLARMARGLCDLAGQTTMASYLELVVTKLARQDATFGPLDDDELSQAFDADPVAVREARASFLSSMTNTIYRLVPVVAVYAGAETARQLIDREDLVTLEGVERELAAMELPRSRIELIKVCTEALNLAEARDHLGIGYRDFNDALVALAPEYQPILNPPGHQLAVEAWLASNRGSVLSRLTQAHSHEFEAFGDLSGYARLRTLSFIAPDPEWLMECDMPSDEEIALRADRALLDIGVPSSSVSNADFDAQLASNRRLFAQTMENAQAIVAAWSEKNGLEGSDAWTGDKRAQVVGEAEQKGLFDFAALAEPSILRWIDVLGYWPSDMPTTLELGSLGLTQADIDSQRDAAGQAAAAKSALRNSVIVDGQTVTLINEDFSAIIAAVLRGLTDAFLRSGRNFAHTRLAEGPHRGTGAGQPGGTRTHDRLSDLQRKAIGLAGELAAFEWLKRRYPECSDSSWKSTNAGIFLKNGTGDDGLGYDFEVVTRAARRFYEVKATPSPDKCEFEMGESEVQKAQDLGDSYRILYVRSALSRDRTVVQLRNPFTTKGRAAVRMMGTGVRFRFQLE